MTAKQAKDAPPPWIRATNEHLTLKSVGGGFIAILLGLAAWWVVEGHWVTTTAHQAAVEKADTVTKTLAAKVDADAKALATKVDDSQKAHAQKDEVKFLYVQKAISDSRAELLEDHKFECDTKKATQAKLSPLDAATCSRYDMRLQASQARSEALRKDASDANKEKP